MRILQGLTLDLEHHKSRMGRDCQTGVKRPRPKPLNVNGTKNATEIKSLSPFDDGEGSHQNNDELVDQPAAKISKDLQDTVQEEQVIESMEVDQLNEVPEPVVDGEVEVTTYEGEHSLTR